DTSPASLRSGGSWRSPPPGEGRMRTRKGAALLLLLVAGWAAPAAAAGPGGADRAAIGETAVDVARDFWDLIQQIRGDGGDTLRQSRARTTGPQPQAIPPAADNGLVLDL